jgi:RNA-binding protein 39
MSEAHSPAANGIHVLDRTPDHKSYVCLSSLNLYFLSSTFRSRSSVDTPRTKRSHRSRSRSHERHSSSRHHREKDKDKERTHDSDRKRRSSRSRDRHSGGHSDREREKERRRRSRSPRERHEKGDGERDKERERDRDRDRFRERDRDRDRERDERRRRKRDEDELPPKDGEDRSSKRLRDDKEDPSRMDIDVPDKVPRDRSRDSERRRERERARYSEERRYRERDELDRRPPPPPDRRRIDDVPMGRASPMRRYVPIAPLSQLRLTTRFKFRRPSPTYDLPSAVDHRPPEDDDSEARSVFVSQLAARLTARDLGYFFEDKLGENTVRDSRIVTDRLSRRSKGYVPFPYCEEMDFADIMFPQNRVC